MKLILLLILLISLAGCLRSDPYFEIASVNDEQDFIEIEFIAKINQNSLSNLCNLEVKVFPVNQFELVSPELDEVYEDNAGGKYDYKSSDKSLSKSTKLVFKKLSANSDLDSLKIELFATGNGRESHCYFAYGPVEYVYDFTKS